MEARVSIPEKLGFLFEPHRYKVAYGGRDAAKSTTFAKALLIRGIQEPIRIGCFREVQKSIKDSVHKLLSDQIEEMGLSAHYEVLQTEIRGKNGTEILFAGLSSQTRDNIKSFERLNVAWVEEAQSVSKRSWDILIPTIRAPDSEVWVSFNPDMNTDDTFKRFVENPPPDAIVVKVNYTDNPWRSKVLDAERERMRVESPEDFAHIYLGECRPAVEGAIYYNEVSALKNSGRLMNVPYDPMLKAHIIADLGFNDFMAMLVVQRRASEIRIIRYIEDRFRDVPFYSAELRNLNYNWGSVWLPHDARAKTLAAASNTLGATVKEQFQNLGWKCEDVPNIELEQGIRKTREVFPRFHVDKANAGDLVSRWGRYRRRVNSEGQGSTPMHDDASHGADGTRYLAIVADQLTNESEVLHVDVNSAFRRRA